MELRLSRLSGLTRVVATACVLVLLGAAPAAADPATSEEAAEALQQAHGRLDEARALAGRLSTELDRTAERYEHAQAHRLRLEDEAGDSEAAVEAARHRVVEAETRFARQVASTYMRPDADMTLAESVAVAPDAATALHRVALLSRIAQRHRVVADRALGAAETTADASRQHQVVQAGALGAEEDAERLAGELSVALGNAEHQIVQASAVVEEAEETRDRIVEEERRATELAARSSGPLPPVEGKVCPIGVPNGFIDSWGYPRSGGRQHKGVDIFAAHGTPIYAVADGLVRRVWWNRLGGLSIDLVDEHGDRYYYAHLSQAVVDGGERVRAGQVLGANGNTGNARTTPPHLHWQYHPGDGPAVNPYALARTLCR